MRPSIEICEMDAVTLADHVRHRRLSPVEVVEAALERIEAVEPEVHAFCTPTRIWPGPRRSGSIANSLLAWRSGRSPAFRWA